MPWADFYTAFFDALAVPAGWLPNPPGAGGAVKTARSFELPNGGGCVWVGFSGRGNSRSVKIERFAMKFADLGAPHQRAAVALQMRDALAGANLPYQSGHDHRVQANLPGDVDPPHYWRTTNGNALVADQHPAHRGSAVVPGQIGVERAGKAGRIVAWRPELVTRPHQNAQVPEADANQAMAWLEAAMHAIG